MFSITREKCLGALAAALLSGVGWSCSGGGEAYYTINEIPSRRTTESSLDTVFTGEFDPLGLPEDKTLPAQIYALYQSNLVSAEGAITDLPGFSNTDSSLEAPREAFDTYRIQLFNSRVFRQATLEKAIAAEVFEYSATLAYEVPYFKVRIGDFADRLAAEEYLRLYVKPVGYPDSWVTRVRVIPDIPAPQDALFGPFLDSLMNEVYLSEGLLSDSLALDSLAGDSTSDAQSDSAPDSQEDSDDL